MLVVNVTPQRQHVTSIRFPALGLLNNSGYFRACLVFFPIGSDLMNVSSPSMCSIRSEFMLCPRISERSDILGHAHVSTTEIYARIDSESKRRALEDAYEPLAPDRLPDWREDRSLLDWLDSLGLATG